MQKPIQKHRKIRHTASKTRKVRYSGRRKKTRRGKVRGGAKTRSGGKRTRGGAKIRGGGKRRTRGGKRTRGGGFETEEEERGRMWKRLSGEDDKVGDAHEVPVDSPAHEVPVKPPRRRVPEREGSPTLSFGRGSVSQHRTPNISPRQQGQQELPEDFRCGCQDDPHQKGEYYCTCGDRKGATKEQAREITTEWLKEYVDQINRREEYIQHMQAELDNIYQKQGKQRMAAELHQLRMQGEAAADDGRRSGQIPEGEEDDGPGPGWFDRPQLMHSERMQGEAAADDGGRWGQIPEDAKDGTRW